MKVLELIYLNPNKLGGFERYCIEFSKYLQSCGSEHILFFKSEPCEDVSSQLSKNGAKWFVRDLGNLGFKEALYLTKFIRDNQIDVVHIHFYPIYSAFSLACMFIDCKLFATYHISGAINKSPAVIRLLKWMRTRILGAGLKEVFCVSNHSRKRFLSNYQERSTKASIIYNGVPIKDFHGIRKEDCSAPCHEFKIICVAALIEEKGVQDLLLAVSMLKKQLVGFEFKVRVVGEGAMQTSLQDMARKLNIQKNVDFLGLRNDVPLLLSKSHIVVVPSRWEEAFGLTIIEGMAAGLPVIGTRVGGIPEIIEDQVSGILVRPYSPNELAAAIQLLYLDLDLRKKLGMAAIERAKSNFNIEEVFSKQCCYYKDELTGDLHVN